MYVCEKVFVFIAVSLRWGFDSQLYIRVRIYRARDVLCYDLEFLDKNIRALDIRVNVCVQKKVCMIQEEEEAEKAAFRPRSYQSFGFGVELVCGS